MDVSNDQLEIIRSISAMNTTICTQAHLLQRHPAPEISQQAHPRRLLVLARVPSTTGLSDRRQGIFESGKSSQLRRRRTRRSFAVLGHTEDNLQTHQRRDKFSESR